jgi:hypothetical protein
MYIHLVGDFILIWQQHQLYMYLVIQSLLVLIVFFFCTSVRPRSTEFYQIMGARQALGIYRADLLYAWCEACSVVQSKQSQ